MNRAGFEFASEGKIIEDGAAAVVNGCISVDLFGRWKWMGRIQ